jgi:hypothetical protein
MKKILFAMIAWTVLLMPAFAATSGPSNCPLVAEIKTSMTSVNKAYYLTDRKSYMVAQVSNYNTPHIWGFGIIDIDATTETEAVSKAKAALPTLAGTPRPLYVPTQGVWACLYSIGNGYRAIAVNGAANANSIAHIHA